MEDPPFGFSENRYAGGCAKPCQNYQLAETGAPPQAVVLEVLREVDGGHAALSELALDAVAVGEGGAEAVRRCWQGSTL